MSQESILLEVLKERRRQNELWGQQDIPDGTGTMDDVELADSFRSLCASAVAAGRVTYREIFLEEVFEAMAEKDNALLRGELIQAIAVGVQWVEKLDREAGRR